MGQVWSSADFDGTNETGYEGGRGSVLAVTLQNPGPDGIEGTSDDAMAPLNRRPSDVSLDAQANDGCGHAMDRIRNFISPHVGGGTFLMGDGSVRFISENIDMGTYKAVSTISGNETVEF